MTLVQGAAIDLQCWFNIQLYYINTNEIPGELSRENMISSHEKITCYFHMWKYHRCDGYIINKKQQKKKQEKSVSVK